MLYFDIGEIGVHLLTLRGISPDKVHTEHSQFLPSVFHSAVVMFQTSQ